MFRLTKILIDIYIYFLVLSFLLYLFVHLINIDLSCGVCVSAKGREELS